MSASKFSYKVREALYIASLYPEDYPELAQAARVFEIKARGDRVLAVPTEHPDVATIDVKAKPEKEEPEETANATLMVHGYQTVMTIIEKCIDTKKDSISFPDAELSDEDLIRLYRWAAVRNKLLFVSSPGITVQTAQDDLRELAWTPEDLV